MFKFAEIARYKDLKTFYWMMEVYHWRRMRSTLAKNIFSPNPLFKYLTTEAA